MANIKLRFCRHLHVTKILILLIILCSSFYKENVCIAAKSELSLLTESAKNIIDFLGNKEQARYLSPSIYSNLLLNLIKYLVKNVFSKPWATDSAIKRLDNLKNNLISYYTTKVEFEARDKGLGFPSLEGALLSLAFLTFSVFLIDLIQNFLAKLRMKKAASSTTPAPTLFLGREFLPIPYNKPTTEFAMNGGSKPTSTYPGNEDKLTTLSSKVLSAIEKPISFTAKPFWSSFIS